MTLVFTQHRDLTITYKVVIKYTVWILLVLPPSFYFHVVPNFQAKTSGAS